MQKHPKIFLAPGWDPIPDSVLGCPSGLFPPFCSHSIATGIPRARGSYVWPIPPAAAPQLGSMDWAQQPAFSWGWGDQRGSGENMGMWSGVISMGALQPFLCWYHTLLPRIDGPSCGPFPAH